MDVMLYEFVVASKVAPSALIVPVRTKAPGLRIGKRRVKGIARRFGILKPVVVDAQALELQMQQKAIAERAIFTFDTMTACYTDAAGNYYRRDGGLYIKVNGQPVTCWWARNDGNKYYN